MFPSVSQHNVSVCSRRTNAGQTIRKYEYDFTTGKFRFTIIQEITPRYHSIHFATFRGILDQNNNKTTKSDKNYVICGLLVRGNLCILQQISLYFTLYRCIHAFRYNPAKKLGIQMKSRWNERLIHIKYVLQQICVCKDLISEISQYI
jgi:hypothetical protein